MNFDLLLIIHIQIILNDLDRHLNLCTGLLDGH
jgi:hypothetical protein